MDKINTQEITKGRYKVFFNTNYLGDLVMDVDGYFYYWPSIEKGAWSSYSMRMIADKMDELNKPWDDYIEKNLKQ